MKTVITPARNEVAFFYSDFKEREDSLAPSKLTIHCGYGSKYDLQEFNFDLCDEDIDEILNFLKTKVKFDIENYKNDYAP